MAAVPYRRPSKAGIHLRADRNDDNDLDDQVWENPFDIAKGHRGFLDGDYVLLNYAWSPNWKSNSVGNDHYNFYVRRSFDGGLTWTTTPADKGGVGITVPEYYCVEDPTNCVPTNFTYAPGVLRAGSQRFGADRQQSHCSGSALLPDRRDEAVPHHPHRLADRQRLHL